MTIKRSLPERLHEAYNWTDAAGELITLKNLRGTALDDYIAGSAGNASAHESSVTEANLLALHLWLNQDTEEK